MAKVVIFGSRGVEAFSHVEEAMEAAGFGSRNVEEGVSGGARGADRLGERWFEERGIPIRRFIPDWNTGRGAGFVRNREMADYADEGVGVWDGKSNGTRQMAEYMDSLGKPVLVHTVNLTPSTRRVHNKRQPFDIYIGRPGPWGNKYVIGQDGTRAEVVAKHRADVARSPLLKMLIRKRLAGKVLGCWCGDDEACHGDNFIDVIEGRL